MRRSRAARATKSREARSPERALTTGTRTTEGEGTSEDEGVSSPYRPALPPSARLRGRTLIEIGLPSKPNSSRSLRSTNRT